MRQIEKQVAILGGGCAALWLLYELSQRGFEAILIDHHMIGKFASTRNQSWLHTGALYAVSASKQESSLLHLAKTCRSEFPRVRQFCEKYVPNAIDHKSACLFLFSDHESSVQAAARVTQLGIGCRELKTSEIIAREPGLFDASPPLGMRTAPTAGFETDDFPFDSNAILVAVAQRAARMGGDFLQVQRPLNELRYDRIDNSWNIEDDQHQIRAQICVCASGALIPEFGEMFAIRTGNAAFEIQKCIVAVLHKRICTNIIVFRDLLSNYLNLVPFEWGTTVNMGASDRQRASVGDLLIEPQKYKEFADKLFLFTPGVTQQVPIPCHFYICQKLGNVNDSSHPVSSFGHRHYFWREEQENFFLFYAGKFTLSWAAARSLLDHLATLLDRPRTLAQVSDPPPISPRPYFGSPSHTLKSNDLGEIQIT
jgi:hypothetical protein